MNDLHISPVAVLSTSYNFRNQAYIYAVQMERHLVEAVAIDLDTSDTKGRFLGHSVTIIREEYAYGTAESHSLVPADDAALWIGESFVVVGSTLRDGKDFGASQSGKRVKTLAEALALREAIFAKARKTVSKRSGVKA